MCGRAGRRARPRRRECSSPIAGQRLGRARRGTASASGAVWQDTALHLAGRLRKPQRPDERPVGQDATASPEASERPETSATPETAATNDMAVAFAALGAELKGLQNREERQVADLAERNAQLAELVAERAKAEKAIAKYAALEERAKPWWRRLVGWIHTRRGLAARKRLRERL
jgi:hypothetical protein